MKAFNFCLSGRRNIYFFLGCRLGISHHLKKASKLTKN